MNKGLLFVIPIMLTLIVGLALMNVTAYAPLWAGIVLVLGTAIVFFYIRNQKHNDEPGAK